MLRDREMRLKINTVLMRQNINDYSKVYELARSIGASFQADPRVTPKNDGDPFPLSFQSDEDDLSRIWADHIFNSQSGEDLSDPHSNGSGDDIPCRAAHTVFYVSPYGDVSPCVQFPILCGNLRDDSFEEIWYHSPQMLEVRSVAISQLPVCSKCDLLEYCRTCPGLAFIEEGNFRAPSKRVCQEARIIRDTKLGG
jgi:radical SAM protein with 4Fe4S-binding SPASM domain